MRRRSKGNRKAEPLAFLLPEGSLCSRLGGGAFGLLYDELLRRDSFSSLLWDLCWAYSYSPQNKYPILVPNVWLRPISEFSETHAMHSGQLQWDTRGSLCWHLYHNDIQYRNPYEPLPFPKLRRKTRQFEGPHKAYLQCLGFILVSPAPHTCFHSLKQMKIVKQKGNSTIVWSSSNGKRLPRPADQDVALQVGHPSRPQTQAVAQKTAFLTAFPGHLHTLTLNPGAGPSAGCHQRESQDLGCLADPSHHSACAHTWPRQKEWIAHLCCLFYVWICPLKVLGHQNPVKLDETSHDL